MCESCRSVLAVPGRLLQPGLLQLSQEKVQSLGLDGCCSRLLQPPGGSVQSDGGGFHFPEVTATPTHKSEGATGEPTDHLTAAVWAQLRGEVNDWRFKEEPPETHCAPTMPPRIPPGHFEIARCPQPPHLRRGLFIGAFGRCCSSGLALGGCRSSGELCAHLEGP